MSLSRDHSSMDYTIKTIETFKVIGFQKEFTYQNGYLEIPKFWDEICEKYANNVYKGNHPTNVYEKAIVENRIGEYGVCIDDLGNGKFRYIIAGKYMGGEVPEGMTIYEFPKSDWAIFDCIGPIPEAFQSLNTKIFKEWLPNNPKYELSMKANIEWYDFDTPAKNNPNYHSAIWIPVKEK